MILAGATLQAFVLLPLVILPLVYRDRAVFILVVCVTVYYAGANLATPLWISLMGDLVPERKRGRFFGRRTRLATMTAFVSLVASGVVLHQFDAAGWTVFGFLAIFVVAAIARGVSVYHLSRMHEPGEAYASRPQPPQRISLRLLRHSHARYFTLFLAAMQGAAAVAAPFFSVYMLRDLQFSYLQFMANTGMAVLVQFLTLHTLGADQRRVRQPAYPGHHRQPDSGTAVVVAGLAQFLVPARYPGDLRGRLGGFQPERWKLSLRSCAGAAAGTLHGAAQRLCRHAGVCRRHVRGFVVAHTSR